MMFHRVRTDVRRHAVWVALKVGLAVGVGAAPGVEHQGDAAAGDDLFRDGVVPRLEVEISPEALEILRAYHQVWRQPRPERIDARVTVREGSRTYTNVAVHLKGSFTYQDIDRRPSLTVNFDKFAPGQRFHGLQKIHLNNSVQDPSYLSEALAREVFLDAGVPCPRAGHAFLRINGREVGLYVILEASNKQFIRRHFASTEGNLYDGGSGGDVTSALEVDSGDHPEDRSDLKSLVAAARETYPSNRLDRLRRVLDVERFRNFAAVEMLLVHWDGYCTGGPNNYRVFHDAARDQMVFMPHGLDQLFGVSSSAAFGITPNFKGVVAKGLFSIPEERQRYLERMGELLAGECSAASLHRKVERRAALLRQALAGEPALQLRFDAAVEELKSRITQRMASVSRQLERPQAPLAFDANGTARLTAWRFKGADVHPASGGRDVEDGRPVLQVRARGGTLSSGAWRTVVLLEEGRYEFSGRGRAAGLVPAGTNAGVILRASGERSLMGLSTNATWTPLRYEFNVHGIANTELVAEFRGVDGTGFFDANAFRLVRKGQPVGTISLPP
jgi:hypothetical protein